MRCIAFEQVGKSVGDSIAYKSVVGVAEDALHTLVARHYEQSVIVLVGEQIVSICSLLSSTGSTRKQLATALTVDT